MIKNTIKIPGDFSDCLDLYFRLGRIVDANNALVEINNFNPVYDEKIGCRLAGIDLKDKQEMLKKLFDKEIIDFVNRAEEEDD